MCVLRVRINVSKCVTGWVRTCVRVYVHVCVWGGGARGGGGEGGR